MCMNCGCGEPEERHGNDANITASDLRRAADANGQSMGDTVTHIQQSAAQMSGMSPSGSTASGGSMGSSGGASGSSSGWGSSDQSRS